MQAHYGNPAARNLYRLAMHLALIAGSIMFSIPFIWMATTSLKEDDEQMTEKIVWVPRLPPYQERSPFVDARGRMELDRPADVKPEWWPIKMESLVTQELDALIEPLQLNRGTTAQTDSQKLIRAAIWRDIARKIPATKYYDEALLKAEIKTLATEAQIRQSHRGVYRALVLGEVSVRGEGEGQERHAPRNADGLIWKAAPGAPVSFAQTKYLKKTEEEMHYDFKAAGERAEISTVLPYKSAAPLKAIAVALKADASWNQIWFSVEVNGERYDATEPYLLGGAGKRYSEVTYQLPSPQDDDDLRIHEYRFTRKVTGSGFFNQPGRVKISLSVENTSRPQKVYDKALYNYREALRYIPFWRYLLTSLFLVAMNVVLAIFSSSLIAYAFARLSWPGRDACWALLLATVMLPVQVTMIPNFLIFQWLGWFNTTRPLWIGSAFGSVFFIFMLRQFMKGIPKDLEDAAKIDGCSYWQIFWNVIVPLVKPTMAAIGIFQFMWTWNDFMGPLMYLSDQRLYPLSLGLFAFQSLQQNSQGMLMAASLMMTIPVICLFFVAQKQFIQGIAFTGIKG